MDRIGIRTFSTEDQRSYYENVNNWNDYSSSPTTQCSAYWSIDYCHFQNFCRETQVFLHSVNDSKWNCVVWTGTKRINKTFRFSQLQSVEKKTAVMQLFNWENRITCHYFSILTSCRQTVQFISSFTVVLWLWKSWPIVVAWFFFFQDYDLFFSQTQGLCLVLPPSKETGNIAEVRVDLDAQG